MFLYIRSVMQASITGSVYCNVNAIAHNHIAIFAGVTIILQGSQSYCDRSQSNLQGLTGNWRSRRVNRRLTFYRCQRFLEYQ